MSVSRQTSGIATENPLSGWHPCVSRAPVAIARELVNVVTVPDPGRSAETASKLLAARAFDYHWSGAGPLSLKCVLRGVARYSVGRARFDVNSRSCLILNHGQHYEIEARDPLGVEMLVVFLAPGIVEGVFNSLEYDVTRLLDEVDPDPGGSVRFFERLLEATPRLTSILDVLVQAARAPVHDWMAIDEALVQLARHLLREQGLTVQASRRLATLRPAARHELYRRLLRARDFARSCYSEPLRLQDLAQAACLSPSHLLRSFRAAFGITPHQFVRNCRLQAARDLLLTTDLPVTEICLSVGFESLGTFGSLFRRRFGVAPGSAREKSFRRSASLRNSG